MTITVTDAGLNEINGESENTNGLLYAGYSNYTMRITYSAKINPDTSFVYGKNGNNNEVVLTWKRTSSDYYDTLIDDAHVYSFGIDLTKKFSDKESDIAYNEKMFEHVKFKIYNENDKYWLTAVRDNDEGVYYVTGHVENEADATIFYPVKSGDAFGKVIVRGCEDDTYRITEVETADDYTLLKDSVYVTITASEEDSRICDVYSKDVLGALQNDPCYGFDGDLDLHFANIPQKQLSHNLLTASAVVDGNQVIMGADEGSLNAFATLTVVNTRGFDLPNTGDVGTWMYGVLGLSIMASAAAVMFFVLRKKED
jgi:LPXTG-motif cell wall-anchored protein